MTARLDWPTIAAMDGASLERRLIIAFEGQGYHFQHLFPNGFLTIIKDDFARHAHKQAGHFREFESKPRLITHAHRCLLGLATVYRDQARLGAARPQVPYSQPQ